MNTYRCDWCGRFYSSPLPDSSACRDHIPESNARAAADIARFNARLSSAQVPLSADAAKVLYDNLWNLYDGKPVGEEQA